MRCEGCWTVFDAYLSLSPSLASESDDAAKASPVPGAQKEGQGAVHAALDETLESQAPFVLPILPNAHRRAPRVIDVPQAPCATETPAKKPVPDDSEAPTEKGAGYAPVAPVVVAIAPRGPLKARRILPLSTPVESMAQAVEPHAMDSLESSGVMALGGKERAGGEACLHGIENGAAPCENASEKSGASPVKYLLNVVAREDVGCPAFAIQENWTIDAMPLAVHEEAQKVDVEYEPEVDVSGASSATGVDHAVGKRGVDHAVGKRGVDDGVGGLFDILSGSEPAASQSSKDAADREPRIHCEEVPGPIERRGPLKSRRVEWGGLNLPEAMAVEPRAELIPAPEFEAVRGASSESMRDDAELATEDFMEPETGAPAESPKSSMFTRALWARLPEEPSTALERARLRARSAEEVELHGRQVASAKTDRVKNIFAAGGSVILALALVAQVGYSQRYEAYSRGPALRPMLDGMCRAMGCKVGFVLARDALSLEGADVRLDAKGGLVFSGSLKNAASYESKAPRLWVSIEGDDGEPLASRIYEPAEWLGAESIKAGSEREARMALKPLSQSPSGYKAELVFDTEPAAVQGRNPL